MTAAAPGGGTLSSGVGFMLGAGSSTGEADNPPGILKGVTLTFFPFDIHLKCAPPPIIQATSCCACPCHTFSGAQFKPLLSPFALQSSIASCSCSVSLKMLAFSFIQQRSHPHRLLLKLPINLCSCGAPLAMLALSQAKLN